MRYRLPTALYAAALALAFAPDFAPLSAEEAPPIRLRQLDVRRIQTPHGQPLVLPLGKGYLGVSLIDLTPDLLDHFNVRAGAGVMVSHVETGSPADKAGIETGDVITEFDGDAVESSWDLQRRVRGKDEGEGATIEIWRNGKVQSVAASIAERERAEIDLAPMFLKRRDGKDLLIELDPRRRDELRERLRAPRFPEARDGGRAWSPRRSELEGRMKELEKRIAELEKLLEKR